VRFLLRKSARRDSLSPVACRNSTDQVATMLELGKYLQDPHTRLRELTAGAVSSPYRADARWVDDDPVPVSSPERQEVALCD
jgi:hypothetical protein